MKGFVMRSLAAVFSFSVFSVVGLVVSTILSACGDSSVVTDRHIRMAAEKCEPNGGVQQVEQASATAQTEGCGYRCSRRTGVINYKAAVSCKNGAKFDLTWQE